MSEFRFANKVAVAGSAFLAGAGTVLSFILLADSVRGTINWYDFPPAVLYIFCFATLGFYTFSKRISTITAFRCVLVSYGLVVAVTGIFLPPVYPHGTETVFLVLSVLILFSLVAFDRNARNLSLAKILLTIIYGAEVLGSFAHLFGDPMLTDGNLTAKLACFIRPVIISTLAVCYLVRMYEKSKES